MHLSIFYCLFQALHIKSLWLAIVSYYCGISDSYIAIRGETYPIRDMCVWETQYSGKHVILYIIIYHWHCDWLIDWLANYWVRQWIMSLYIYASVGLATLCIMEDKVVLHNTKCMGKPWFLTCDISWPISLNFKEVL